MVVVNNIQEPLSALPAKPIHWHSYADEVVLFNLEAKNMQFSCVFDLDYLRNGEM